MFPSSLPKKVWELTKSGNVPSVPAFPSPHFPRIFEMRVTFQEWPLQVKGVWSRSLDLGVGAVTTHAQTTRMSGAPGRLRVLHSSHHQALPLAFYR